MNILEILKLKYPTLDRVTYWATQYDGTAWAHSYDGLVWENTSIPKPTKAQLTAIVLEYKAQADLADSDVIYRRVNKDILNKLDKIDLQSIRPLRENDTAKLADLQAQAVALRAQLVA